MKDEYIAINENRCTLNSASPEEWDKASNETLEKLWKDRERDWALETRKIAYGRASDYVDSDEPTSDTPVQDSVVNEPSHYLDVPEEFEHHRVMDAIGANYHFSNAMKYLWRAGKKSSQGMTIEDKEIQDVRKAIRYLEMWCELRKEQAERESMTCSNP